MAIMRRKNQRDTTDDIVNGPLGVTQSFVSRTKEMFVILRVGSYYDDKTHIVRMTQEEAVKLIGDVQQAVSENIKDAELYEQRYGARDYWQGKGKEDREALRDLSELEDWT